MTIKNKMLYSIICFVIIPMFFMPIIIYPAYKGIVEEKINIATQQTLAQVANNIGAIFDNMIAASNMLCFDRDLAEILRRPKYRTQWEKYRAQSRIDEKIINAKNATLYPYNADIIMIDFDGNIYSSSPYYTKKTLQGITSQKWFQKSVAMNGYMLWLAPAGDYLNLKGEDKKNIAMARLIKDPKGARGYGVLLISLYQEMILGSLLNTGTQLEGSRLFLINNEAKVVLANESSLVGTSFTSEPFIKHFGTGDNGSFTFDVDNQKTVVNYYTVPKTEWKVVQLIPYKILMKEIDRLRSYQITVNVVFLAALVLVSIFISWTITHPLHHLSLLMQEVPKGNFRVRVEVEGKDEVAQLGRNFNIMVREIEALIKELNEAHELREKARLEALQAQINPHFLLNTLNGIKWMATMNGAANVSQMLASLGKLLETTLARTNEMIPLSNELECIESYVYLQKMRYGDTFAVKCEIEEALYSYPVPCLILQPLVENSIIHGFENMESGGKIIIKGYSFKEAVIIEVVDNGKGIDSGRLKSLLTGSNKEKGRFTNIGLKNVHERIALRYGAGYGLNIKSREGEGTSTQLYLPPLTGGEEIVKTALG